MPEAVEAVLCASETEVPALVVTPNVDHVVRLERDPEFAAAYAVATLRFADGSPIVLLSKLLGTPLPERVTGVDLTEHLIAECARTDRSVFFFGGAPEALERAVAIIAERHPDLRIDGAWAPKVDLDAPTDDERRALEAMRTGDPAVVFVFLGAPKQEKWFLRRRQELPNAVFLGVGGTVDLVGGAVRRAPQWVQRIGFEWLWRLGMEPRRLFRRYVVEDSRFALIAARLLGARWWPVRR
jgi:N-acetylglucosaminyldiphosphoundecaprenol N-acetyl-beta-D-mannosaminyltransferase